MQTLQSFVEIAPYLPQLIEKTDIAIWATDLDHFLIFDTYGRFDIPIKAGDPLTPGGTPELVIQSQEKISRFVPRDVYGFVCKTVAIPVEGGAIGFSIGVENEEQLQSAMDHLNTAVDHIGEAGVQIANNSNTISEAMVTVTERMGETAAQLREIDKVGELIREIADQSRLISLNALIESARAGENGRSFTVVAKEMQKLADETTKSIHTVRGALSSIHELFGEVQTLIHDAESQLRTQTASTEEISAALQEVGASVKELQVLAKLL
jgi:hypothetical protein